jgi:hypothetical protein
MLTGDYPELKEGEGVMKSEGEGSHRSKDGSDAG